MYKVVDETPKNWDVDRYGSPLIVLQDQYGGQSVINEDDHCLVLYNGSEDREFVCVNHWYKEAVLALRDFLDSNPDYIADWYTC